MSPLEIMRGSVIGFNNKSLHSYVETFLNNLKIKSNNTYINYKGWIKEFFTFAFGKECAMTTWHDIKKLEVNDIKLYITHLKNKGNSNNTVNQKIEGVKSLFEYLRSSQEHKADIDIDIFKNHRLPTEDNTYGSLTYEEYTNLLEFAKTSYKGRNPNNDKSLIKSLFFETCYVTALRKEAVLNLSWSKSFQRLPDADTGEMIWVIKERDKGGKKDPVAISDEFYQKLLTLKKEGQDLVFNVKSDAIYNTLNEFCKHYGINKEQRNIGVHSLKSTSGETARILCNNDITKIQEHLHHSDPRTTMQHYMNKNKSYKKQVSYIINKKIDDSKLDTHSKEELINAIKKSGMSVILSVLKNLEK